MPQLDNTLVAGSLLVPERLFRIEEIALLSGGGMEDGDHVLANALFRIEVQAKWDVANADTYMQLYESHRC